MFRREHASFESSGRIARNDRYFELTENLACIELLGHDVHRTATDPIAGLDRASVSIETPIFR